MNARSTRSGRDRGLILPMVLVVSVVLSLVVIGITRYGTANLRYSQVTESRSDQLAAADAAMSYAANLIRIGAADCIYNDQTIDLPPIAESFNGATGSVECSQTGGGLDSAGLFAMVLTGEGISGADYLVETQGGSLKEIGGPVFMERVDANAFNLANNKGLLLKKSPLLHYEGTMPQCEAISENVLDDDVDFEPDAVFGPICTGDHWYDYGSTGSAFDEPEINVSFEPLWDDAVAATSGGSMLVYDGEQPSTVSATLPLTGDVADLNKLVTIAGGYTDDAFGCRVFEPGRYVRPPDLLNTKAYFKSGEYLLDFRDPSVAPTSLDGWTNAALTDAEFEVDKSTATAGSLDPGAGIVPAIANPDCANAVILDTGNGYGATFYLSAEAHIALNELAVLEIMPRDQSTSGDPLYVAVHALCDATNTDWCTNSPATPLPSARVGVAAANADAFVSIKAGQTSEIVTNGLIYSPLGELNFRNVSNNAEVRIRGGMVVARATIHAAASADNFEIGVGTQNIDLDLYLTATGTDTNGGSTRIVSDVDFHYDDTDIDTRLDVISWRVCETLSC